MSNLIIRDLAGDKALDKDAMGEIKGGFYFKPFFFPVFGYNNTATAEANAYGQNTNTQTYTETRPGESHSGSSSSSSGGYYGPVLL